jgi:preprotein translocase subunit SecF
MEFRMNSTNLVLSVALSCLLVACGGGSNSGCSAGLGALVGSAANCGSSTAANVAPIAKTGPIQNVSVGTTVTLDGAASTDANNQSLTYKWELTSKPAGSTATLSSVTSAQPTFKADFAGTYTASLVVNDGQLSSALVTATVVAAVTNSAPVANPGVSQSVVVGAVVTLDGSASTDANGDALLFKWSLIGKPTGSKATLTNPTYPNPKFTADLAGNYIVSLLVNDGKVDSDQAAITITASTVNAAPVANAGVNQSVVIASLVTLDGSSSSDANGDPLTYKWVLLSKPTGSVATLTSATSAKPTFTADLAGSYVATLIVNDGKVDSTISSTVITASAVNATPVANAGVNQSVVVASVVTLDGSASSDANGDSLTYKWVLLSKPTASAATLSSSTATKPTFTADLVGTYVASLIVNDGKVDSTVVAITISAAVLNAAPVANAGSSQTVTAGTLVTLTGAASTDANGDALTYKWTLTTRPSGSSASLSSTTVVSPTIRVDIVGTYVASLIVNDGKIDSTVATVPITATTTGVTGVSGS